jgi:hypothetical protein
MTRATRPGSVEAAVALTIRAAGGVESVADDLGLSLSTVSYWTERREDRPGGAGIKHLDALARIVPAAAAPVAQHFAALAGGVFQPVQPGAGADIHALTREFSDVLAQHAAAMDPASGHGAGYSAAESAVMLRELDQLQAVLVGLRSFHLSNAGGV